LCRDRKREVEDPEGNQETKKPRLMDKQVTLQLEEMVNAPVEEADAQDVPMEPKAGTLLSEESFPPSTSKGMHRKVADDGGSFKEQPYTFLAPEDPIILKCM